MFIKDIIRRIKIIGHVLTRCDVPNNFAQWFLYAIARGHPFDGWKTRLSRYMREWFPTLSLKGLWGGKWVLTFDPGDITHMVIFEELVINRTWNLDLVPFEPDLIIDVGAHIGIFASLAGVRFRQARVICIEPDQANLIWLRHNLKMNLVTARVIEGAAGDSDGRIFFEPGLSYGGRVVEKEISDRPTLEVANISLRRIILEENPKCLLLKIDIEGAEELVLPTILEVLSPPCFLFLETHGGNDSYQRIANICKAVGFQLTLTRSHGNMRECYAIMPQK
ncbi:FkbM family methyltransferase [Prosthecobacter sp.]|jgi:FkbM family methyltransferase|uniref:FkbM family methyltransferase n=1 Tax=Prosthecobacter sp. TaxID=1965333 RepID=UPI0037C90E12